MFREYSAADDAADDAVACTRAHEPAVATGRLVVPDAWNTGALEDPCLEDRA